MNHATLQNFNIKDIEDLENVQRNKKKQEFIGSQVSSNQMSKSLQARCQNLFMSKTHRLY
jgi:3-methyladenine DNA glycosylase Tag